MKIHLSIEKSIPALIVFTLLLFLIFITISKANASILSDMISLFTKNNKEDNFERVFDDTSFLLKSNISDLDFNYLKNKNVDENNIKINSEGAFVVESGPMRISTEEEKQIDDTISLYEVKSGDSIATIAKLFNVSKNTIIWANNLKNQNIKPGDVLLIFPISGLQYTAKNTVSLASVAKKYRADLEEIATYNGISTDAKLAKGDTIFIPDAELEIQQEINKNIKKPIIKYKNNVVAGYFMKPVSGCIRSQGLHGQYNTSVDFACRIGTQAVAAAAGTVIRADASGYNGGYGEVVIITHPNGTQSIYAHLSRIDVVNGQKVSQGQVIGATGNTGRSTGPHLHFETRGTSNPF